MNAEKLAKLQSQVRIGGKGTARRKKKVVHRTATTDDKKLQTALKKMGGNTIPGIEEVNMFRDDGTVLHFNNPKVQAAIGANTFAVTGQAESKKIQDMMPSILNQLRPENIDWESLSQMLQQQNLTGAGDKAPKEGGAEGEEDDDIPELVDNFEEAAKK